MDSFGLFSLIPIIVILVLSVWTKETFMPIVMGVAVGYLMIEHGHPLNAFYSFVDGLYTVLMDENTVWVLMLVALFGSLIMLMKESGGVMGFSNLAHKVLKTRKSSMVGTWVLGIIIFVDDYLNCLAIGAAVRDITDKHKVSREMLAYIVNSTGVTDCSFIPISSWAAYMGALMVTANMTGGLSAFNAYVHTMPFIAYGWIAVICVPLFCLGVIPLFGPMKKAEQRAIETGQTLSDTSRAALVELPEDEKKFEGKKVNVLNFLIPILIVAVLTVTTEDILIGLFAAVGACLVMYLPQRLMSFKGYFKHILGGMVDMFPMLVIIIVSYLLIDINTKLGLVDYVVDAALNNVNPAFLPVTIFVVIGLLSFASGSFWGLAAIAFPIVGPLAAALGVSPFLASGALISAVCFGGHICMYSDTVILTAASTQTTNAEYFRTSAPLVAVPFVLAAIVFLIFGFAM
jgi:Na+/H+ antiporter NhaC